MQRRGAEPSVADEGDASPALLVAPRDGTVARCGHARGSDVWRVWRVTAKRRQRSARWAAALAAGAVVCGAVLGCAAEPPRVRVLTYNIHHGEGTDGQLVLARIAEVIRRAAPDLVALQEVDNATRRSHGVDQAAELGRLTGMRAVFGKAMDYDGGGYGEAVLSRFPLSEVTVHALPFTAGREPRCALSVRVELGAGGPTVLFAATHLEHARETLRLLQTQELDRALTGTGTVPAILAGDLNDGPDSPPLRLLLAHWTDAAAGRPQPTWPAAAPESRIDYVLLRPAGRWRVVEEQVIDERTASDHRPLLVVLAPTAAPGNGG
jgi:endonuclease/exonuclease/phosphatase family metal-dependent hydrolase